MSVKKLNKDNIIVKLKSVIQYIDILKEKELQKIHKIKKQVEILNGSKVAKD